MKRAVCILLLAYGATAFAQDKTLYIDPVYQETPVWCWVSVGQMIFEYYDVCCINPGGDYQCGIIALLGPACDMNCYNCQVPAGSPNVIQNMLREYPRVARQSCGSDKYSVSSIIKYSRIDPDDVIDEIDNDRPIIAGISPSGNFGGAPSHVALIVGYEVEDEDLYLIVNDPFPYEAYPMSPDPYLSAGGEFVSSGQYRIEYANFTRLHWTQSFVGIE